MRSSFRRKHLTPEQRRKPAAALVSEIEGEAAAHRERTGVQPLGPNNSSAGTLFAGVSWLSFA